VRGLLPGDGGLRRRPGDHAGHQPAAIRRTVIGGGAVPGTVVVGHAVVGHAAVHGTFTLRHSP